MNNLCGNALHNCGDSDMMDIPIGNEFNMKDQANVISFRRKEQIPEDDILKVLENIRQCNSSFNALDMLRLEVHSLKMP